MRKSSERKAEIIAAWQKRGRRIIIADENFNILSVYSGKLSDLAKYLERNYSNMKSHVHRSPKIMANCLFYKRPTVVKRNFIYWEDYFYNSPLMDLMDINKSNGTNYKIEKDVPVPISKRSVYPFRAMEIGDSILVDENYSRELMSKYNNAARNFCRKAKLDWNFITRKTDEGIRVWRVK